MLNVGIFIKSFLNENLAHYYFQVFLEKCSSKEYINALL